MDPDSMSDSKLVEVQKYSELLVLYLSKLLKVRRESMMTIDSNICQGDARTTATEIQNTDLLIIMTIKHDNDKDYVAYARSCALSQATGRSMVGLINFNSHKLDLQPQHFQKNVETIIHELMHILAFSSDKFHLFLDPNNNYQRRSKTVI